MKNSDGYAHSFECFCITSFHHQLIPFFLSGNDGLRALKIKIFRDSVCTSYRFHTDIIHYVRS